MQLFTFIYSKRTGTKAAEMPDPTPRKEKTDRMSRLLKIQDEIAMGLVKAQVGQTVRVLVESFGRSEGTLSGRLDILIYDTNHTRDLLLWQLRIRMEELESQWHYDSLERIFFENRIYKLLELDQKTWEEQMDDVFSRMKEFQDLLRREITREDIDKLVEKPVRKISKFDTKVLDEKIRGIEAEMAEVQNDIEHITDYTIEWFRSLRQKYGKPFVRQTEITAFETIAVTKVVSNNAKLNMIEAALSFS